MISLFLMMIGTMKVRDLSWKFLAFMLTMVSMVPIAITLFKVHLVVIMLFTLVYWIVDSTALGYWVRDKSVIWAIQKKRELISFGVNVVYFVITVIILATIITTL